MIRDRPLSVSGVLRPEIGGARIPIGAADTAESWRRSIYLQAHRTMRRPTLSLFDPPSTECSVGARSTGASPEGALFALDPPLVWDLAERFAKRVESEAGGDMEARIRRAYLLALSRPPTPVEIEIGLGLLRKESDRALVDYCHVIHGLNEFICIQ